MMAGDSNRNMNDANNADAVAMNEQIVISSVRQQELAEHAREAERKAEAALSHMMEAHEALHAAHEHHYIDTTINFQSGDTILLSTDGLSEARQGKDFLGEEGVDELVRQSMAEQTLRGIGIAILTGAREFVGGKLTDDACIVLLRRH